MSKSKDSTNKSLVEISSGFIATDSQIVAREFGVKHAKVLEAIERVLKDYPDLRVRSENPQTLEIVLFEKRFYRGQEFEAAIMNRPFFTLLLGRFETKRAREKQRLFNGAFYEMESRLLQQERNQTDAIFQGYRKASIGVRKEETDAIKVFVEYAKCQGSQHADWYYKSFTNATYRALGLIQHKQPKLRETIASLETVWLISAEHVARQSLFKHMEQGEFYKDIFKLVVLDIETFAQALMPPARINPSQGRHALPGR